MLRYNIPLLESRDAERLFGAPVTAAGAMRWPGAGRGKRPPMTAIGAAMLLHVAACLLALAYVRVPQPPPPEEQAITLVFEPPAAPPAAAPESAPPPAETEPPAPPDVVTEPPPLPEAVAPPPEPPPPPLEPQSPPPIEATPAPAEPPPPPPVLQPEAKPREPSKPVPPPVAHKPMSRPKPAAPARVTEAPADTAAEASPAARPTQPAAVTPIPADWQHSLAAWLAAHKTYPELARQRGVEGSVALRFTADRSGRVLSVSVVRSAGSPVLDAAAEAMVRDATLPPFPAGMPQQTATVTVAIRYALTN